MSLPARCPFCFISHSLLSLSHPSPTSLIWTKRECMCVCVCWFELFCRQDYNDANSHLLNRRLDDLLSNCTLSILLHLESLGSCIICRCSEFLMYNCCNGARFINKTLRLPLRGSHRCACVQKWWMKRYYSQICKRFLVKVFLCCFVPLSNTVISRYQRRKSTIPVHKVTP